MRNQNDPAIVLFDEVFQSQAMQTNPSPLAWALGKDERNQNAIVDLESMIHVLIVGSSGTGKTTCVDSLLCSLLQRATPKQLKMILINPKAIELSVYNGVPHLLLPVIVNYNAALGALSWAVAEAERRLQYLMACGARDLQHLRSKQADLGEMPSVVIVIDGLMDLMSYNADEVQASIGQLARSGRTAGVHLVLTTTWLSTRVRDAMLRADIPSRIAFDLISREDSRVVLGTNGAECLRGNGDMLCRFPGKGQLLHAQGCFVPSEDISAIIEQTKQKHSTENQEYIESYLIQTGHKIAALDDTEATSVMDELFPQAVGLAVDSEQVSISMLQRKLRISYARAARMIDEMARQSIVAQAEGAQPRLVLMSREEYEQRFPNAVSTN